MKNATTFATHITNTTKKMKITNMNKRLGIKLDKHSRGVPNFNI
jgi:hypothetical protein